MSLNTVHWYNVNLENRSVARKTLSIATSSVAVAAWTTLGSNVAVCSEKLAADHLSHGITLQLLFLYVCLCYMIVTY